MYVFSRFRLNSLFLMVFIFSSYATAQFFQIGKQHSQTKQTESLTYQTNTLVSQSLEYLLDSDNLSDHTPLVQASMMPMLTTDALGFQHDFVLASTEKSDYVFHFTPQGIKTNPETEPIIG